MSNCVSDWREGDLIMKSYPFAHVLMIQERDRRCENCFRNSDDLLRCSSCKMVKYCNITCQRQSWKCHRHECKCFQRISPNIPKDGVLLYLRIILRLDREKETEACEKVLGTERRFCNLISHVDQLKTDATRCEEFLQLCSALKVFVADDFQLPAASQLIEIFGKMTFNSFSICDAEMQPIGGGIYLGASILDHSCRPNSVVVFSGTTLEVRCTRNIANNEQVLISYIDQLDTTVDRQKQLETCYYFICKCPACLDEHEDLCMHSSCCTTQKCPASILQNKDGQFYPCSLCGRTEFDSNGYLEAKKSATANCVEVLECSKQLKREGQSRQMLERCEKCLKDDCDGILHKFNIQRVKLLDRTFDACIDTAEWSKAVDYGVALTELYRHYLPRYHPTTGIHLMKLGKIQVFLERLDEAEITLNQALSELSVTHGTRHAVHYELQQLLEQCSIEQRHQRCRQPRIDAAARNDDAF